MVTTINILLSLVNTLAVLAATIIAARGISAWRNEHAGKKRIDLAEETLALFYEAEDAIHEIRSPVSFTAETEDIRKSERETNQEHWARQQSALIFKRYSERSELFNKLHAMRYRFMAQVGKSGAKPFEDLRDIVFDLKRSSLMLRRLWAQSREDFEAEEQWLKHVEKRDKYESVFWEGWGDTDPVNPRVEALISEIEATCRQITTGERTIALNHKKRSTE